MVSAYIPFFYIKRTIESKKGFRINHLTNHSSRPGIGQVWVDKAPWPGGLFQAFGDIVEEHARYEEVRPALI
jgi:hypothetical protein